MGGGSVHLILIMRTLKWTPMVKQCEEKANLCCYKPLRSGDCLQLRHHNLVFSDLLFLSTGSLPSSTSTWTQISPTAWQCPMSLFPLHQQPHCNLAFTCTNPQKGLSPKLPIILLLSPGHSDLLSYLTSVQCLPPLLLFLIHSFLPKQYAWIPSISLLFSSLAASS